MSITTMDGIDFVNSENPLDLVLAIFYLFPIEADETHEFTVYDPQTDSSFMPELVATSVDVASVLQSSVIDTPTGEVGYIVFNNHFAPAEIEMANAIIGLVNENVSDLILDMRYNGGGLVNVGSQVAYQIAGEDRTEGKTYELLEFNDKYPTNDPFFGDPLEPIPFIDITLGYSAFPGQSLFSLDLDRVFILSSENTCSASESVINSLEGIGVDVILIGDTTCGKPYGFLPTDNCGTTYFSIHFRGVNDMGFGDFADGFSPINTNGPTGVELFGCSVLENWEHQLGDEDEALLSAALGYRMNGICPTPPDLNPVSSKPSGNQQKSQAELGVDLKELMEDQKSFGSSNKLIDFK